MLSILRNLTSTMAIHLLAVHRFRTILPQTILLFHSPTDVENVGPDMLRVGAPVAMALPVARLRALSDDFPSTARRTDGAVIRSWLLVTSWRTRIGGGSSYNVADEEESRSEGPYSLHSLTFCSSTLVHTNDDP